MKKIIIIIVLGLFSFSCKEDRDYQDMLFGFNAEISNSYPEIGLNETVSIPFSLITKYDFSSISMSAKVISNKVGVLSLQDQIYASNESIPINNLSGVFNYTGKELGTHTLLFTFENANGYKTTKEVDITFNQYGFNVNVLAGSEVVYQGQNINYRLQIVPEKNIQDTYQIKFISFDELDRGLEKTSILFEGNKIEFDKFYTISNLDNVTITTNAFYSGTKKLVYVIKNNTSDRNLEISQSIQKRTIVLKNFALNKNFTDATEEILNLLGTVEKQPIKTSAKIYYKTWLSQASNNQTDGIETTNNVYQEYNLPNNDAYSLNLKTKKAGNYILNIQFKDEYNNESEYLSFEINVYNKDFDLEQIGTTTNLFQGQEFVWTLKVLPKQQTNEQYQIRFTSFDELDRGLEKSKIIVANNTIALNTWYPISITDDIQIKLYGFNPGVKNITYEIKNSVSTKSKMTSVNLQKTVISLDRLISNKTEYYINEPFTISGTVDKTFPNNKNIKIKTWLSVGNENYLDSTTRNVFQNVSLANDNIITNQYTVSNTGTFVLNYQAEDEFGNQSSIKQFNINVKSRLELEITEGKGYFTYKINTSWYFYDFIYSGSTFKYKIISGSNANLSKVDIKVDTAFNTPSNPQSYTENKTILLNNLTEYDGTYVSKSYSQVDISPQTLYTPIFSTYKVKIHIKAYDIYGNTTEKEFLAELYYNNQKIN